MPTPILKQLFWPLLILTLATMAALTVIDLGFRTHAAPQGIVSFELCAYADACAMILAGWSTQQTQLVILSLGLDYLFMVLYPALLCVALLLTVPHVPARLQRFTAGSACAIWIAGLADAVENYFLTQMVLRESVDGLDWAAALPATLKFALVLHALLWLGFVYFRYVLPGARRASVA